MKKISSKKISLLEKEIKLWKNLDLGKSDIEVLLEFAETGETSLDEVNDELERFINTIEDLELKLSNFFRLLKVNHKYNIERQKFLDNIILHSRDSYNKRVKKLILGIKYDK